MSWIFRNLRFALFASAIEFVKANDLCRTEVNIQGMALKRSVFKRWSMGAPNLCDAKCGQEITCQSYNYNRKYQICELNNRTKEARPENFLPAPGWFYIRRLEGRVPLGSIYELPALSCQEIKASEGKHTTNGKYWLNSTRKGKALAIYCDMINEDMDECKSNMSDCDVNADCTNTYGSYNCTCKVGYTGDGHLCSDIDECKGNHSCHVNASCQNTIGSYVCECRPGYSGNGQKCTDIDECSNGSHVCDVNANCTNTEGSHNCTCKKGYIGNGKLCQVEDCPSYSTLTSGDRKTTYWKTGSLKCDNSISSGWYRFQGAAGTKMPTTCPPADRCGTRAPGWLNGVHPTVAEGQVTRKVCFHLFSNCCTWSTNIQVRNCDSYYVYNLSSTSNCYLRYCSTD